MSTKIRNEYSETVIGIVAPETEVYGENILFEEGVTTIIYTIIFEEGYTPSAYIETSSSKEADIEAGDGIWIESDEFVENISDYIPAPNAIRIRNEGEGELYFSVRSNR